MANNITLTVEVKGLDDLKKVAKLDDLINSHWEFRNYLLNYRKNVDMTKAQLKTFNQVFEDYFGILTDNVIDLEDLTK